MRVFSYWHSKRAALILVAPLSCWLFQHGSTAQAVVEAPAFSKKEKSQKELSQIDYSSIRFKAQQASALNAQGKRVPLALDAELQRYTKKLLVRAKAYGAAAVIADARTGQVLAAIQVGQNSNELLFNSTAPAASLFKLVTTAALYEHTPVSPSTRVCTRGGLRKIEREHLTPAKGTGAICAPFAHALGVSRNAAYAQLATQELMHEELLLQAEKIGFNHSLALDTPGQTGSLSVPYNDLEFARTAAGFKNSRLSVFGAAQIAMLIANDGRIRPLHFQPLASSELGKRAFMTRTARRIRKSMEVTIHSGTARESFVKKNGRGRLGFIQVAGKTGTLRLPKQKATSSWFVGIAPSNSPKVVVSIVLQNPDKWHQKAHQVGRDLLLKYFSEHGVKGLKPPLL